MWGCSRLYPLRQGTLEPSLGRAQGFLFRSLQLPVLLDFLAHSERLLGFRRCARSCAQQLVQELFPLLSPLSNGETEA